MTYPQVLRSGLKDNKDGVANNPSAGDNPNVEVNAGSSVIVLPEAANVAIVKGESKGTPEKMSSKAAQPGKDRNKRLVSVCFILMFITGTAFVGITAIETVKHVELRSSLRSFLPKSFTIRVMSETEEQYHMHNDLSGNEHRTTLASSDHCIHRRNFEMNDGLGQVLHDTSSKWSVLINKNDSQCFLFATSNLVQTCPLRYPWAMDELMGVLNSKVAMENSMRRSMTRVVSRLYTSCAIPDISCTGKYVTDACKDMRSYEVRAVSMCYIETGVDSSGRSERSIQGNMTSSERYLYDVKHNSKLKVNNLLKMERTTISNDDVVLEKIFSEPMKEFLLEKPTKMLSRLLRRQKIKEHLALKEEDLAVFE